MVNWLTSVRKTFFKKAGTQLSGQRKQRLSGNVSTLSLSKEQTDILLKEYELCTIDANHLAP